MRGGQHLGPDLRADRSPQGTFQRLPFARLGDAIGARVDVGTPSRRSTAWVGLHPTVRTADNVAQMGDAKSPFVELDDVGNSVVFLASDEASSITGKIVPIIGKAY